MWGKDKKGLRNEGRRAILTPMCLGYGTKAWKNLSEPLPGRGHRPSRRGEDNGFPLGFLATVVTVYLHLLHLR